MAKSLGVVASAFKNVEISWSMRGRYVRVARLLRPEWSCFLYCLWRGLRAEMLDTELARPRSCWFIHVCIVANESRGYVLREQYDDITHNGPIRVDPRL